MRTVLVCVRTPMAAQSVVSCAARLGVATLRTAVSEAEALARLAEQPAGLILADTAVTRPDTVGFTQRVLAQAPGAVLVLFGAEEPRTASAAVSAGARGVIRGGDHDLVGTVAKALLLIGSARGDAATAPGASANGAARSESRAVPSTAAARPLPTVTGRVAAASGAPTAAGAASGGGPAGGEGLVGGGDAPSLVPVQRGDAVSGPETPMPRTVRLRAALTERELQVLHGMADGRSNAEIGRDLFVSEDTVKTHARRLFRKLGARDRAHAVAVGFRSGVLP